MKKKAKRVKRYVIGRAIRPGSLEDTGHENWYCYGEDGNYRILPVYVRLGGSVSQLFIDGEEESFNTSSMVNNDRVSYLRLKYRREGIQAFSVRKYEWTADENGELNKLRLWLESKTAPQTVTSESTHHSFVGGKRVWRGNYLRHGIVLDNMLCRFDGRTRITLAKKMRLTLDINRFVAWKKTKGELRRKGNPLRDETGATVTKCWWKRLRVWYRKVRMPGLYRIREKQDVFGRLGEEVRVRLFVRYSKAEMAGGGMAGEMERKLTIRPSYEDRAWLHVVKE